MKIFISTLVATAVVGALLFSSCGGKPEVVKNAAIRIEGGDNMRFNKTSFQIKVNAPVSITMANVGKMAKETMGHNLVILKPGTDKAKFATAAMAAKDTDYIPASFADSVLASTKLLGPGEEETFEFTATEVGEYPYICSFVGHSMTMRGTIIVSE